MRLNPKLAVALLAGIAIGGIALNGLHAQAKPPAYSVVELVELHDPATMQEFAKRNRTGILAAGGRFLAFRGRIVAGNGTPPRAAGIVAWDNLDQAVGYFNSPYFKDLIPLRDKAVSSRLFFVEGLAK